MEDLVRVGVADAAEDVRIGQRSLQRVALAGEGGSKLFERNVERLDAARIVRADGLLASDDMN